MPSIVNLSIGQALQERLEFLLALLARQYLDWFAPTLNEWVDKHNGLLT